MAAAEVVSGTPLAEALQNAVQPKLAENGWSSGAGDDSALSEYIILMLANGKNQEQIASELANDLLGLDPEDSGPIEFAQWLFDQVAILNSQLNGVPTTTIQEQQGPISQDNDGSTDMQEDTTMGSAIDTAGAGAVPTGPKSMRTGGATAQRGRDRRMAGQMRNALDRGNDAGIHRIRGAASRVGRDNAPGAARGVGSKMQKNMASGMQRAGQPMNAAMMANMAQSVASPQQQMALYQMLEEQSRMMAELLGAGQQLPGMNQKFHKNGRGGGKSLFERVDGRGGRQNGHAHRQRSDNKTADENSMDTTEDGKKAQSDVPCKFQLACTSPACPFAHQSPAASPGTTIDTSDVCTYGAACTNKKCVGSHPSPAQKRQYLGSTVDCKFYPNCTNPSCPFRHPAAPPCRNGADCPQKDTGCRFSHSTISCRYNPCLNPHCVFKHAEGQKGDPKEHVSQRRFTAEDAVGQGEELILPGGDAQQQQQQQQQGEDQAMDVETQHAQSEGQGVQRIVVGGGSQDGHDGLIG